MNSIQILKKSKYKQNMINYYKQQTHSSAQLVLPKELMTIEESW